MYNVCGYFDSRPEIHISMFGIHLLFRLPFHNKGWEDECDSPGYGIWIHKGTVFIEYGGKGNFGGNNMKSWDLPFFTRKQVYHKVDVKGRGYVDVDEFGDSIAYLEKADINKVALPYVDSYDNTTVNATIWKEIRVWRPKWLTWCSLFDKKHTSEYIEIEFSGEVGRDKGSWKGGCTGCSYDLLPGESAEDCLKRMEKERKF